MSSNNQKMTVTWLAVLFIACSGIFLGVLVREGELKVPGDPIAQVTLGGVPREPIYISSNAEFNLANGVSGGWGTLDSPFIIANWVIDACGGDYCIRVQNTTAYFRIEFCWFENATMQGSSAAIQLVNASNGWILNTTCARSANGISSQKSNGIICRNCTATGNVGAGIFLQASNLSVVQESTCWNNGIGILATGSRAIFFYGADCRRNGDGVVLRNCTFTSVTFSTCTRNARAGIELDDIREAQVYSNDLSGNGVTGWIVGQLDGKSIIDQRATWAWWHGWIGWVLLALVEGAAFLALGLVFRKSGKGWGSRARMWMYGHVDSWIAITVAGCSVCVLLTQSFYLGPPLAGWDFAPQISLMLAMFCVVLEGQSGGAKERPASGRMAGIYGLAVMFLLLFLIATTIPGAGFTPWSVLFTIGFAVAFLVIAGKGVHKGWGGLPAGEMQELRYSAAFLVFAGLCIAAHDPTPLAFGGAAFLFLWFGYSTDVLPGGKFIPARVDSPRVRRVRWGAFAVWGILMAYLAFGTDFWEASYPSVNHYNHQFNPWDTMLRTVFGPLGEELFFGLLIGLVAKSWGQTRGQVFALVTIWSAWFAWMHVGTYYAAGGVVFVVVAFLTRVSFTLAFLASGSVAAPAVLHGIYNFLINWHYEMSASWIVVAITGAYALVEWALSRGYRKKRRLDVPSMS